MSIDPYDAYIATTVMQRICEVSGAPLDVPFDADTVRAWGPHVVEHKRYAVDTTARVLEALTKIEGHPRHTVASVGYYDTGEWRVKGGVNGGKRHDDTIVR